MLKNIVDPESTIAHIKNPEKVAFKPTELLKDLSVIYGNLSEIDHFCKAVVKDDRSFKTDYFNQALRRLKMAKVGENLTDFEKFMTLLPKYT